MFKLRYWLDRVAMLLSCVLCGVFMLIVIYNVGARYFFDGGIQWYMESSQYLNIWSVFIAGIGICATNDHLRVAIIDEKLRGKPKTVFFFLSSICTIAFYVFVAYSAYLLASRSRQTISTMGTLKMSYVYWLLPFVSGLSAFAVAVDMICHFLGGPKDKEGEAHDHLLVD